MILAPLRGVTTRCFRQTFANEIAQAGFTEIVTPFISAAKGLDPLKDRELRGVCSLQFAVCSGGRADFPSAREKDAPRQLQTANCKLQTDEQLQTSNCKLQTANFLVVPQFIGKDPEALRSCLERVKGAGFALADLNVGCPFPMVRNKGRGSGLLRTPDVLRRMLEIGCEVMGAGNFSVKARLGVDRPDELLALMPLLNCFPLRRLCVHARTARQMYSGECDKAAFAQISAVAKIPLVYNGDVPFEEVCSSEKGVCSSEKGVCRLQFAVCSSQPSTNNTQPSIFNPQLPTYNTQHSTLNSQLSTVMIGRSFIRYLGGREDAVQLLERYIAASLEELGGDRPVLGRMKELIAYWKEIPHWKRIWPVVKISRSLQELREGIGEL